MANSDVESADGDDEVEDDGQPGFDLAADISKMSEAQRRKWDKSLKKWRLFVDFLLRHISIVTFKYNCFELEEMTSFMLALEQAESLRMTVKLKKGETAKISSILKMKESVDLLLKNNYLMEANRIRKYIDLVGRMRGLSAISGGFYKALKKGKVGGLDRIKYNLDHWKGCCVRSFDFTELAVDNIDVSTLSDIERQYISWPTVLRTSIFLAQNFLRKVCESTGLELVNTNDTNAMLKHMQAAEFIVATKMEEMLFERVMNESVSFIQATKGSSLLTNNTHINDIVKGWSLPSIQEIDPVLLKPVPETSILLVLPSDPPKEKKGKKKRKGGGKKGKKAGGHSASSRKGGKKKKK